MTNYTSLVDLTGHYSGYIVDACDSTGVTNWAELESETPFRAARCAVPVRAKKSIQAWELEHGEPISRTGFGAWRIVGGHYNDCIVVVQRDWH